MTTQHRTRRTVSRASFVVLASLLAILLATFGSLAASSVPEEVYIQLPGRYGSGPYLGSLPALQVAIWLFLAAATSAAWAVFVGIAPWRFRSLMVRFPPIAYLAFTVAGVVLFSVDDSSDETRIVVFVFVMLPLALFGLILPLLGPPAAEPPTHPDSPVGGLSPEEPDRSAKPTSDQHIQTADRER